MSLLGRIPSGVARKGAVAAGLLAALMIGFVAVGIALPGSFEVTRSVEVGAPPQRVFPFLNDLAAWDAWTPWGAVESRIEGPSAGAGARRTWDDERMGEGWIEIAASDPPREVRYAVEVEGGALRFDGVLSVTGVRLDEGAGDGDAQQGGFAEGGVRSRITWTERADLGWNPLLGWSARSMEASQGAQMAESLSRLRDLAEEDASG